MHITHAFHLITAVQHSSAASPAGGGHVCVRKTGDVGNAVLKKKFNQHRNNYIFNYDNANNSANIIKESKKNTIVNVE